MTQFKAITPAPLTKEEQFIVFHKGTERPFSGALTDEIRQGTYYCRVCGEALFRATDKFTSTCGWASFDATIPGAVKEAPDADGLRTEILCAKCDAHLGHVFRGEGYTSKSTRHCVNSASLIFIPGDPALTQVAIFAGGCFWGIEHAFASVDGVLDVLSGYTGGTTLNPNYEQVCSGKTGHAEAVCIVFDPQKTSYEALAHLFFELHDPTELNRQGPDIGTQYRSAIFYLNKEQHELADKLIALLRNNGYAVQTQVQPVAPFYPAETYHQDYFAKHPERTNCHIPVKRFEQKAQ